MTKVLLFVNVGVVNPLTPIKLFKSSFHSFSSNNNRIRSFVIYLFRFQIKMDQTKRSLGTNLFDCIRQCDQLTKVPGSI